MFTGCNNPKQEHTEAVVDTLKLEYARHFRVLDYDTGRVLQTLDKQKNVAFEYVQLKGRSCNGALDCYEVPVNHIGVMTSSYVAAVNALQSTDRIIAIPNKSNFHSQDIVNKVNNGSIHEVGNYKDLNLEVLVELNPEAIFTAYTNTAFDIHEKLLELSIPAVNITAHLEQHPLGKLEWLKFFGTFLHRKHLSDSLFNAAKKKYQMLKSKSDTNADPPKVLAGYYKNGTWVAPGGQGYFATLMADAGMDYVFKENQKTGNITINFEHAYEQALDADLLIYMRMGNRTWQNTLATEPRLSSFKSVKENAVYSNDAQVNEMGRNNYWEQGFLEPHELLNDLIKIAHEDENDGLVYFQRSESKHDELTKANSHD